MKVRISFQAIAMPKSESEKVKVRSSFQAIAMPKSESEKVKVRSSCQDVDMLLPCKKVKINVRK